MLRVLQEKEIIRIGSSSPVKVDVRIVAATNRNLEKMVAAGQFREDLLYRLSVFNILVPPLRERKDDFPELCRSLLDRLARELGKPSLRISDSLVQRLAAMQWPGNVRQLKNALERAAVLSEGRDVEARFLLQPDRSEETPVDLSRVAMAVTAVIDNPEIGLPEALEALERRMIAAALEKAGGTKSRAAEILKIPRTQLLYRMKKLGLGEGDD